jgi:phosphatidylglycerophosphate synthase
MVSLVTLGVSFASGLYFAFGGYWNALIGAVLSVWASILDGCDGEVARMKLQVSDFGCWLDTACDYLYYIFLFGGMTIGLTRSTGERRFLVCGAALFFGAITMFIVSGLGRKRLSGAHPEQYLAVWQKRAESRLSNPLIYIGRYTEFILRRCFLPYAILVLALFNLIPGTLYLSAFGANVAWIIALRSHMAFSTKQRSITAPAVAAGGAMHEVSA